MRFLLIRSYPKLGVSVFFCAIVLWQAGMYGEVRLRLCVWKFIDYIENPEIEKNRLLQFLEVVKEVWQEIEKIFRYVSELDQFEGMHAF